MHCVGDVYLGVGVYPGGVYQGVGVCPGGGCVCPRVSAQGGVWPGGVSGQGVCIPACTGSDPPCGQTDTYENITFLNFAGSKKERNSHDPSRINKQN